MSVRPGFVHRPLKVNATEAAKKGNSDYLFIYGDNFDQDMRFGNIRSVLRFRDMPNAFPIFVKKHIRVGKGGNLTDAYLNDDGYLAHVESVMNVVVSHVHSGRDAIIPLDVLRMGTSKLNRLAPELYHFIEMKFDRLRTTFPCDGPRMYHFARKPTIETPASRYTYGSFGNVRPARSFLAAPERPAPLDLSEPR